ncbi:MAG TPA: GNAT family N-acetyltransferase [Solirubrobacteraceae bacterium]|nr:GNAT family N-acetyltransferase [Solirubrobacteraceae bacterium]
MPARWIALAELEDRRAEWQRLAAGNEFPAAFADPRWVLAWWRHYGEGKEPWTLAVEDADGALRGLALLAHEPGGMARTLSFAAARWNGLDTLLWSPGAEREVAEELLAALAERRGEWELWRIGRLTRESALAQILLGGEGELRAVAHDVRLQPYIELPPQVEEFEQRYGGKRRTDFRRRWRRLVDAGAQARLIEDAEEARAYVGKLCALRRERAQVAGQPHAHMDRRFEQFTADATCALLPDGARLWALEMEGELLTAKLNFVEGWREHGYISAVSDLQLKLSPGHALERQVIHAMIEEGRREFDLGPGRDEYKYRWGAVDRELVRALVPAPTARGRLASAPAALDLRLRNTGGAEALRRRRGIVPERATAEHPARTSMSTK